MKEGFEVVGRVITERRMTALGVVMSDVVVDFQLGFGQPREAAGVEQLGLFALIVTVSKKDV